MFPFIVLLIALLIVLLFSSQNSTALKPLPMRCYFNCSIKPLSLYFDFKKILSLIGDKQIMLLIKMMDK